MAVASPTREEFLRQLRERLGPERAQQFVQQFPTRIPAATAAAATRTPATPTAPQARTTPATVPQTRAAVPSTTRPTLPTSITPRPISPQVQEAFQAIQTAIQRQPITERDIMRSPSFQAAQRVIDFTRGLREAELERRLASQGILRSSPAVQAFAAEGARSDAAIAAAIPQILEASRAQEQQRLQNLFNVLDAASGLEQTAFSQGLQEFGALAPFQFQTPGEQFSQAVSEAAITGRFLPPDVRDLFSEVVNLKLQAEANPVQAAELSRAADAIRAQIASRGFDPSIVGANVTAAQAAQNIGQAGVMPVAVREAIAGLTGVDPVTGQPTFAAREAAADRAAAAARAAAGGGGVIDVTEQSAIAEATRLAEEGAGFGEVFLTLLPAIGDAAEARRIAQEITAGAGAGEAIPEGTAQAIQDAVQRALDTPGGRRMSAIERGEFAQDVRNAFANIQAGMTFQELHDEVQQAIRMGQVSPDYGGAMLAALTVLFGRTTAR